MTANHQELEAWRVEPAALPVQPPGGADAPAPAALPAVRPSPSFRSKLIFFFVLLVLAVAAIGLFISTRLMALSATERFDNHLRESGRLAADGLARVERAHLDALHAMALSETVWPALAAADSQALEASLAPQLLATGADLAAAVGPQGQAVLALYRQPGTGGLTAANGEDFGNLPGVAEALAGAADELGDKHAALAAVGDAAYLISTAPVRDSQNQLVGALLVGTRLDHLAAQLKADSLADVVLLNAQGQLVATTLPADPGSNMAQLELASPAELQPGTSTGRTVQLYNRAFRVAYAPLTVRQAPAGVLGVVLPSDYVINSISANRLIFLVAFGVATLALLVVGYALAQSIAGPVLRLHSVATAAARGDLSQQTGLAGSDELGELGRAVDGLVGRLRERSAETRRLYLAVTERDRALAESRARLNAAQQQLIASDRLATVGQISTGLAQDVANPLSHIVGLADVMADQYGDQPELQAEIEAIRANALQARQMVAELLTFAHSTPLDVVFQDMRQTVSNAANLAGYLAREGGVRLNVHVPDQPALAEYDDSRIEQVLVNLIRNGIQAMPEGGTLNVGLRATDEAVTVTVQDTGVGIAPEHLPRVFDPFFTTGAENGRAGLGLSVSSGIVAAHHGRLDVASQEGRGSIFSLWLPRAQPEDGAQPSPAGAPEERQGAGATDE